jgi:hypothetical protein
MQQEMIRFGSILMYFHHTSICLAIGVRISVKPTNDDIGMPTKIL